MATPMLAIINDVTRPVTAKPQPTKGQIHGGATSGAVRPNQVNPSAATEGEGAQDLLQVQFENEYGQLAMDAKKIDGQIGGLILRAEKELDTRHYWSFRENCGVDKSSQNKQVFVERSRNIAELRKANDLPKAWTTQYQIAQMDDETFKKVKSSQRAKGLGMKDLKLEAATAAVMEQKAAKATKASGSAGTAGVQARTPRPKGASSLRGTHASGSLEVGDGRQDHDSTSRAATDTAAEHKVEIVAKPEHSGRGEAEVAQTHSTEAEPEPNYEPTYRFSMSQADARIHAEEIEALFESIEKMVKAYIYITLVELAD